VQLWRHSGDTEAFAREQRKLNVAESSYAEDGNIGQCFHTPASLAAALPPAGLEITHPPAPVRYPWTLARRYGYGFFPDAPEVWDHFVQDRRRRRGTEQRHTTGP